MAEDEENLGEENQGSAEHIEFQRYRFIYEELSRRVRHLANQIDVLAESGEMLAPRRCEHCQNFFSGVSDVDVCPHCQERAQG